MPEKRGLDRKSRRHAYIHQDRLWFAAFTISRGCSRRALHIRGPVRLCIELSKRV